MGPIQPYLSEFEYPAIKPFRRKLRPHYYFPLYWGIRAQNENRNRESRRLVERIVKPR